MARPQGMDNERETELLCYRNTEDCSSWAWDLTRHEVVVLTVIDEDCKTHIPTSIRVFDQIVGNLWLVMEQREVKTGVILMRT